MTYMMIVVIMCLNPASGQEQETFEGFVNGIRANAVKGDVFYQRGDGKFNLESGFQLQECDFIKTGSDSFAELLLQPGNYLRLGADSELQIFSEANDKMRLKLNRGSLNLEILSKDGEDAFLYESLTQVYNLIRIITPSAQVFVTRPGIFRIDSFGGRTDLIVRDGEAVINGRRVKEKRSGAASAQGVVINEINTKVEDSLDGWSRERAEELVRANRSLKKETPWSKERKEGEDPPVDLAHQEEQGKSARYVVSARPGSVNFVEAGVEFSKPSKEWQALTEKLQLESGDTVRTKAHTFAEIAVLPDIHLRIDSKSEVLFEQLSYDSISVKLLQGSAILDVARFDSKEGPQIQLAGTSMSVLIADDGIYRVDNHSNDEITVRDGKVIFKERSVGSCRRIAAGAVSECYKKEPDNLEFWSNHRGEGKLFSGEDVISMVAHLDRLRRVRFRNTGFWFQNPGKTNYTFVPFHSPLFRSPYGGSYSTVLTPRRVPIFRPGFGPRPPFGRGPIPPSIPRP